MKEKLISVFGAVGFVLWYLLCASYIAVPLVATGASWPVRILLFAIIMLTDFAGSIATCVIFGWGLIVTLQEPFGVFSAVFYVCLVLWLVFQFIPSVIRLLNCFAKK